MRKTGPLTTAAIAGTSVDGFGNGPQFILSSSVICMTIMPPKSKVKGKKKKGDASTPQTSNNKKRAPQAQVFTEEEYLTDEEVSFPG